METLDMTAIGELLRPSEAAVVARADLRTVNRAIDEHILPEGLFEAGEGRRIWSAACSLISFYADTSDLLTAEGRLLVIKEMGRRMRPLSAREMPSLLNESWLVCQGVLTVDFKPYVRSTVEGMRRLNAAREMVESDPEILGGTPVIRGTRVPVYDVAASVAAGLSRDRIREAYPSLDAEQIDLACMYALANPQRGRPRAGSGIPEGATVVTHCRVARRRPA